MKKLFFLAIVGAGGFLFWRYRTTGENPWSKISDLI